jgi:hypothetical protein
LAWLEWPTNLHVCLSAHTSGNFLARFSATAMMFSVMSWICIPVCPMRIELQEPLLEMFKTVPPRQLLISLDKFLARRFTGTGTLQKHKASAHSAHSQPVISCCPSEVTAKKLTSSFDRNVSLCVRVRAAWFFHQQGRNQNYPGAWAWPHTLCTQFLKLGKGLSRNIKSKNTKH